MGSVRGDAERIQGSRAAVLGLVALAAALTPTPPWAVERLYSTGVYLAFQPYLTAASNRLPFALVDVLLAVVAAWWIGALVVDVARRRRRGGWVRIAGRGVLRTIVLASALYLAFLLVWGLNYRRVPLAEKLQFDAGGVSAAGARQLAETAIDHLNALYEGVHAERAPAPDTSNSPLARSFARVQRELGAGRLAVAGRPKPTLLDLYFRRAAVDGMTDPYFLETLVASDLLPFEQPFVVAHEWSHLAGIADEGEANFVGWLTCLGGGDADQYSGWLFLYGEVARAVSAADRRDLAARLAPGPASDRRAIADRIRRDFNPTIYAAGWQIYDRYLKANRVSLGAASYAQVVRLALGARFGPGWTPLLK